MLSRPILIFFVASLTALISLNEAFVPPETMRRFEYKLSFKGPHLIFKDGTIPFWEHGGSAIPSNDQIRLTPSIKSQKGRIWCKNEATASDWEIEVTLRINGRGRIGADGMAIWYADKIGSEGPVYGSNDHWVGLGVFLDSFDNDAQQNNPYILVMSNDGTKSYDHNRDGLTQQLGGCLRDFRNKPYPVRIKLEYYKKTLTVYYHAGLNNDLTSYEICTRVENLDLPARGHFGVSAETGGLADDQDVLSFVTHSLIDNKTPDTSTLSSEEQKKYDKEYEEFMRQLEVEKEKYMKDHPEKASEIDEKKNYEGEGDRQFRTILDVQNAIQQEMRSLDSKMAEILGRQERIVSLITSGNGHVPPISTFNQQQGSGGVPVDTIKRDEVTHIINQQADLVRSIRDISTSVTEIQRKTTFLYDNKNNMQLNQAAGGSASPSIDQSILNQINDGVRSLRHEMTNRNGIKCPDSSSCLSSFFFITVIVVQSLLFFAYMFLKSRSEAQMKKFY